MRSDKQDAIINKSETMKLSDYKALTFDVYGTLIDWESGMVTGLKPLTDRVSRSLSRDDILEAHAYYESTTQRWTPSKKYYDLLAVVYRRLAEEWGVEVTWEECEAYGLSVRQWPAFEDSREALAYLKQHFKLVVLTNTPTISAFPAPMPGSGSPSMVFSPPRISAATSRQTAISTICSRRWPVGASRSMTSCTRLKACSTITPRPTSMALPIAGSIAASTRKASVQP